MHLTNNNHAFTWVTVELYKYCCRKVDSHRVNQLALLDFLVSGWLTAIFGYYGFFTFFAHSNGPMVYNGTHHTISLPRQQACRKRTQNLFLHFKAHTCSLTAPKSPPQSHHPYSNLCSSQWLWPNSPCCWIHHFRSSFLHCLTIWEGHWSPPPWAKIKHCVLWSCILGTKTLIHNG